MSAQNLIIIKTEAPVISPWCFRAAKVDLYLKRKSSTEIIKKYFFKNSWKICSVDTSLLCSCWCWPRYRSVFHHSTWVGILQCNFMNTLFKDWWGKGFKKRRGFESDRLPGNHSSLTETVSLNNSLTTGAVPVDNYLFTVSMDPWWACPTCSLFMVNMAG